MNPVIEKIIKNQEESNRLQATIRKALSRKDDDAFQELISDNRNSQKFLSELCTVLRQDRHRQMTDYEITKQLNQAHTQFVVYNVKGWYVTINHLYPVMFSAFTKKEFKNK